MIVANLQDLTKKLLIGKRITLYYKKYNDGTKENPDILINRVSAKMEKNQENKDIVIYLSKEDEKSIGDIYEIYRCLL